MILAPYGISANLLGYIANDSAESHLTCREWSQFYSLCLSDNLPRVFVVGLHNNTIKLFYPNSFVFIVIDDDTSQDTTTANALNTSLDDSNQYTNSTDSSATQDSDSSSSCKSSDFDKENKIFTNNPLKNKNKHKFRHKLRGSTNSNNLHGRKKSNKSSSFLSNSSSPKSKLKKSSSSTKTSKLNAAEAADKANKEMDSLELTIDSVARNFGTDLATGTDSSSSDTENVVHMLSPPSAQAASSPSLKSPRYSEA